MREGTVSFGRSRAVARASPVRPCGFASYLPVFRARCVEGIEADKERCRAYLELNPSLATLLSPNIGSLEAAELAKEALEKQVSIAELAVSKGIVIPEEAAELFDPENAARSRY